MGCKNAYPSIQKGQIKCPSMISYSRFFFRQQMLKTAEGTIVTSCFSSAIFALKMAKK